MQKPKVRSSSVKNRRHYEAKIETVVMRRGESLHQPPHGARMSTSHLTLLDEPKAVDRRLGCCRCA